MKITFDAAVGALYVYLSDAPIERTRQISGDVIVDYDARGHEVGVEILGITSEPVIEHISRPRTAAAEDGEETDAR